MPGTRGINKLDHMWKDGIFLSIREESNKLIAGTNEGVIKVATFRRGPKEDIWKNDELEAVRGLP